MSEIISVEGLAKKYVIRHKQVEHYATLRDAIVSGTRNLLSMGRTSGNSITAREDFWALDNVSFTVDQGDRIGIIGRNGAGKSTLLKILSRITKPTKGRVTINGRVASLLEVGTGFHPELTGRENVYLNGAILGMQRVEIRKKFDEIVAFAEIEKFLDTPVKRYSSGMYVRLAFAVAAHLEPEILLVDEVLAVGDNEFQKKCLGKMGRVAEEGRTVLFVSHNMGAVANLCSHGIVLEKGKVIKKGSADEAISYYSNSLSVRQGELHHRDPVTPQTKVVFTSIALHGADGKVSSQFSVDSDISVSIQYSVRNPDTGICLALQVKSSAGQPVFTTTSADTCLDEEKRRNGGALRVSRYNGTARLVIPRSLLNIGMYEVLVSAFEYQKPSAPIIDVAGGVYFEIIDDGEWITIPFNFPRQGVIVRKIQWELE
jgi:lipopolysaccharide transport system ATP-binding protein